MKPTVLLLCMASVAISTSAQSSPKQTAAPGSSAKTSTSASAKPGAVAAKPAATPSYKLPPDVKRIPGIPKIALAVRYQDIKVGTGTDAESGKMWHVKYKGWRAADGIVFDQSADHRQPILGKDGKPEMGPDGKPKLGDEQPLTFPQGQGHLIPGFDHGVAGMKVGGKRRIFIPWQFAYGQRNIPDRPDHPGIPAKSDLIFDVELVEVTDAPPMPPMGAHGMPIRPGVPPPGTPGTPATPGSPTTPARPGTPVPPPAAGTPSTPPPVASTPQSAAPSTPASTPAPAPQPK